VGPTPRLIDADSARRIEPYSYVLSVCVVL
jgi:hypothetical protein